MAQGMRQEEWPDGTKSVPDVKGNPAGTTNCACQGAFFRYNGIMIVVGYMRDFKKGGRDYAESQGHSEGEDG